MMIFCSPHHFLEVNLTSPGIIESEDDKKTAVSDQLTEEQKAQISNFVKAIQGSKKRLAVPQPQINSFFVKKWVQLTRI